MGILDKLERKFGRNALQHLTIMMIMTYAAAYVLQLLMGSDIYYYLGFSMGLIARGQVWRLVSWLLIPPDTLSVWTLLMLFCVYQQGQILEKVWGNFKFDFYVFNGLIFTLLGGVIVSLLNGGSIVAINTYYVMLSLFLGLALTFPDMEFRFMMLVPIKAKYLVIFYAVFLLYEIVASRNIVLIAMIVASALNMFLFFMLYRKGAPLNRQQRATRRNYRQAMGGYHASGYQGQGQKIDRTTFGGPTQTKTTRRAIHKCAVCGRTELDNPDLEFRFCSKCNGNYEYCKDHLYNHIHVQ